MMMLLLYRCLFFLSLIVARQCSVTALSSDSRKPRRLSISSSCDPSEWPFSLKFASSSSKSSNNKNYNNGSSNNSDSNKHDNDSNIEQESFPPARPDSLRAATIKFGRVPYGESSRPFRRDVFSHEDWVKHRSTDRLFNNLRGIIFSGIIRQLQSQVALVTAVATFCVGWNDFLVPTVGDGVLPKLVLPLLPFTLSSPALGLLLVFRTNASYQRWMEGRMRWSMIESQAKNMVRMATTFSRAHDTSSRETIDELALASWLVARSIMNQLLPPWEDNASYEREIREAYPHDLDLVNELLSSPQHRGVIALTEASLALDDIPVDEKRRVEADKSLVFIGDSLAACERILTSPVPLVYTRHTSRFLGVWMIMLPFAIHDDFLRMEHTGLPTIPAAAVLSLFLFGIEELAVQLEEPFSILPMQKFCNDIREDTRLMVEHGVSRRAREKARKKNKNNKVEVLYESSTSNQDGSEPFFF